MRDIDEQSLRYLYLEEHVTVRAIADGFGVSQDVVIAALQRWRIARSPRRRRLDRTNMLPFNEVQLRDVYLEQGMTIQEVATHFATTYALVSLTLRDWRIPRHRRGPRQKD